MTLFWQRPRAAPNSPPAARRSPHGQSRVFELATPVIDQSFTRLVSRALATPLGWRVIDATVLRWARYVIRCRQQSQSIDALLTEIVRREMPDLVVRHGPFKGLRYPEAFAIGSSLFPKLLGSYERELAEILESICSEPYTEIIDVGCAEGYYAVGLALRIPAARVWAFDTDQRAMALCRQMAALNGVAHRLTLGTHCDTATVASLPLSGRPLLVCDCEGYENRLFSDELVPVLRNASLLIESHDFIDISTSRRLARRFAGSHEIRSIQSLDDITKAHTYEYPELSHYDLPTRRMLVAEHRPTIMEWLWMTPRRELASTERSTSTDTEIAVELPELHVG
jgi:hypothetical protein